MALQVFVPLLHVLQVLGMEIINHQWVFLVGGLKDAKNEIKKKLKNKVSAYKPILDIVDAKAKEG